MENRRVSKYFYCNLCNQTFNKLVNPDDMGEINCGNCGRSFVEMIKRPRRFMQNNSRSNDSANNGTRPLPAPAFWNQRLAPESLPPINHMQGNAQPEPRRFRVRAFMPMEESKGFMQGTFAGASRAIRSLITGMFNLNALYEAFGSGSDSIVTLSFEDFGNNFASNFDLESIFRLGQQFGMRTAQPSRPPASKKAVSKLPVFKLDRKHCKTGASGKPDLPGCAICCCNIELGRECQVLPCGHMYHPTCIKPWFDQNNTCPTCRYELPTDDPGYERVRPNNAPQRNTRRAESMNPQRVSSRQAPHHTQPPASPQPSTLPSVQAPTNSNNRVQPNAGQRPRARPRPQERPAENVQSRPPPSQIAVHRTPAAKKKKKATPVINSKMIRKPK
eukprot:TRINITY_DN6210_c0_g1_i1.p2 TRINITY_DN6210_c0_g1~~TRINITY_DN6210_c0_g1_i1.p2  ORF type:complete len:388 (-),score=58.48 TRINITY_DN6210_c0_g1_i1:90-1253(-)